MAKRAHPEDDFQEAVIAQARLMLRREVCFWHCPNGGKRNIREAARFKRLGLLPGIPDLAFVRAGAIYFLELKSPKGTLSPPQKATIAALTEAGAQIAVCREMAEVVAAWRKWNLCR